MQIYPDTKIYMICPANVHSGGPELCHQLVSQLIKFGLDAYMIYLETAMGDFNSENPVDDFYKKYHLPYTFDLEDNPKNILILSETCHNIYYKPQNIRKIFWWMSVDNYIKNISNLISNRVNNALSEPMPKFFYFQPEETATEHWVQSEYARQFVTLNGVPQESIYAVEDYLNPTFLKNFAQIDFSKKENIVAFNPLKGMEITQQLIEFAPDIKWVPIKNMTPEQVQNLLALSKVYIDFGNHPGKDRIPREAALSGCVVITGKNGAAANDIDINIPAEFKFGMESTFKSIIGKIRDVFENFDENYLKQQSYRERILDDKPRFIEEIKTAFNINTPPREYFAIAQGLSEKGITFIEMLCSQTEKIIPTFIIDDTFCNVQNLPENDFVRSYRNTNYFLPKNLFGAGIMIISSDDAEFLYSEGQINKIALMNPTDTEINSTVEKLNLRQEDLMIVNVN